MAKEDLKMATIEGHLDFDSNSNQVTLHHVVDGQLEVHTTTILNENRDFGFKFPVTTPGFYYIDYGQYNNRLRGQVIRLYLEPGVNVKMSIQEDKYILEGKENGHNQLVQDANNIVNRFREFNRLGARVTYEDFYPFLENEGIKMVQDFKSRIKTKDKDFDALLSLAVQADFESECFFFFRLPRTAHPDKENRPQIYADLKVDGIKFSDENILKLDNGFKWMSGYFDYYRYNTKRDSKVEKIDIINNDLKQISGNTLKEVYVLGMLKYLRLKPEEYKEIITPLYQYLTSEKSKNYVLEYEKQLHKEEGQPGYEFTYKDVNGNPVSFKDFRGKYVYVDVWATWCGPCKQEIPHLKKLEHDYKGKDIVFMSISVDKIKDKQKWKDFVKSEALGGVQIMADKAFESGITKNYEINAIPRFLLFDKEGKIISTDALRPSSSLIRKQFDELLGLEK
ncbi:TlpA family protein disulfide reductase [Aestuariibaculum suncheonense]|uniref:TlpA family protein disulfide reductase n=1 Tax=Aestuariibaculum suncheonense TaxID=1028745 RepID=A0A8J6Q3L5_9FLAO|nr:TlpA disulfide reductase family protein [Aestuariibaculum suncheonense]MBD0834518.1 TlpA family protein disulfide reductase [Aestuariibaculum suncheonense]